MLIYDVGICSGFFAPLHDGHIEYINAARKQSKLLIVIVNNDKQVELKGSIPFLSALIRRKIIKSLSDVDSAMISVDTDESVAKTLEQIYLFLINNDKEKKVVFFNSGDRNPNNFNPKETEICEKYGIDQVFLNLPKINSSSSILQKVIEYAKNIK